MATAKIVLTVRITPDQHGPLKRIANRRKVSVNQFILRLIEKELKRNA
jgi:predicted HicB family RNase H-like nuclease